MADDFDGIIRSVLRKKLSIKVQAPKGFYKVPPNGGDFTVHKKDQAGFLSLYPEHAKKATIGKGEIALYWLFKDPWGNKGIKDTSHEGGGAADLKLAGKNCEVKSYPKHDTMTLGKFKDDKDSLELLSYLFSFINLFMEFGTSKTGATAYKTLLTFKTDDVVTGLGYYDVLNDFFNEPKIQKKIALLKSVGATSQGAQTKVKAKQRQFQTFAKQLKSLGIVRSSSIKTDKPEDREKLAAKIVGSFLKTKLRKKPGENGYMVNVHSKQHLDIHFHKVNFNRMSLTYDNLKDGFAVGSGEIQITKANAIFK